MNSRIINFTLVVCATLFMSCTSTAQSTSGLGAIFGKGSTTSTTTTTTTPTTTQTNPASSAQSALGSLLGGLTGSSSESGQGDALTSAFGSILGSVIGANQQLTVANLEGTWIYTAPACKFKSEDMLKQAGGDIATAQISEQLAPTYSKLGFTETGFNFAFDAEGNFVMTYKKLPLSGTATKAEQKGYFTFDFVKLGTYSLATTPVYIEVVGDKMLLLFEADKFVNMFKSVAGRLNNSTLNTVVSLLDSYDGVLIGFELTKQ